MSNIDTADNRHARIESASIKLHEGYPAEEILQKKKDSACDAIVMCSHSKKGMNLPCQRGAMTFFP
jgi:hypothetical protein